MRKLATYLAMVAAVGISGCSDKDPVSSQDDTTSPAAKLTDGTARHHRKGGRNVHHQDWQFRPLPRRQTQSGADNAGDAGGRTDNLTVTIDGSVTAAQPGTITRLSFRHHRSRSSTPTTVTITAFNDRSEFQSSSLSVVLAIEFPDAGLEAAVRDAIGKSSGDIFTADVADLNVLEANDREIVDLDGIDRLPALDSLDVAGNQVSDLSLLVEIPLTYLRLFRNPIVDFSPLAEMTSLKRLDLIDENENLTDISFVSNRTNLEVLVAIGSFSDLSPVANLTNMRELLVRGQISDISAVANLTALTFLALGGNQISDISAVANLTALTLMNLGSNQISDISAVANLTALVVLSLDDNQISDLTPLANLTAVESLNLSDNEISDISTLENLTELNFVGLDNNQITDLTALVDNTGLGTDDTVSVIGNPLSAEATSTQIPALEARGVIVNQ